MAAPVISMPSSLWLYHIVSAVTLVSGHQKCIRAPLATDTHPLDCLAPPSPFAGIMAVRNLLIAGRTHIIGDAVARNVGPSWQSVGFIGSVEEALTKIPEIIRSKEVHAIAFGGGYDDAAFGQIWDAAKREEWPSMSWLRPDPEKKSNTPGFKNDEERIKYGAGVGKRVVDVLAELEKEGRLGNMNVTLY